jgi:hypothetical protein
MTKNTKILLGIGAAIALYLIFKPKSAVAQTNTASTPEPVIDPQPSVPTEPVTEPLPVEQENPSPPNPSGLTDQVKATVEPQTKDCVQVGYNCQTNTYNTIQIPIGEDCANYQPAMPNCAPPMGGGGDRFMVAPEFFPSSTLSNFA